MGSKKIIILFLLLFASFCTVQDKKQKKCNEIVKIKINSKVTSIPFNFCATSQKIDHRIWKNINIKTITIFGGLQDSNILNPTIIRPDNVGNIYIIDIGDYSIKKFSPVGQYIKKFGRYGKGPGEFLMPFRFAINNNGNIEVIDPNLKKVVVFNGDKIKEYKCNLAPIHIANLSNDELAIFQIINPIDNSIVQKLNMVNSKITDFEKIFNSNSIKVNFGILPFLNGDIYSNSKYLFYIPELLDFFIIYSKSGSIKFVRKTIDEKIMLSTKVKKITNNKGEKVFATSFHFPKEQYVNKRMNVTDKYLYITSSKASREYDCYVIDVYSAVNGNYQFSFKLKEIKKSSDIFFSDNKIYLIEPNTTISVYKYHYESK